MQKQKVDLNKKYDGFEENREEIEAECYKESREAPCEEVLRNVDPIKLKPDYNIYPTSPYTDFFVDKKSSTNIKDKFIRLLKPKVKDEKKDFSDVCGLPPCNLECFHGRKLPEKEEPDKVKGIVYTKGGAVYETVAYRLPPDFGWEKRKADETRPYFETKTIKKKKPEIMEFTGPVKITIVDNAGFLTSYGAKRFRAAFLQLGHILIGCTVMCIYFYVISFKHHYCINVHIICCLLAFQYCLPAAHLYSNKCSVVGYAMSSKDELRNTLIMKTFALLNIFLSVGLLHSWRDYIMPGNVFTIHAKYGYVACAFTVAEYISHWLSIIFIGTDSGHIFNCYLHILAHLSLVASLESFYYGIMHHPTLIDFFKYGHWHYWVFAFAVFFTVAAILRSGMDCLFQMWSYLYRFAKYLHKKLKRRPPCTPVEDDAQENIILRNC